MTTTQKHVVFVCGATGCQGGAVARHVLAEGWTVHAFTRSPDSPAAKTLAIAGAKIFKGDWDDEAALSTALAGCTALFLNLYPTFDDADHERRQGVAILDLASQAGVQQVVYSGGLGREDPFRMKHYAANSPTAAMLASKWNVEKALDEHTGFQSRTTLRPGAFMANYILPKVRMYGDFVNTGVWTSAMDDKTKMALIDPENIADFAVAALREPERFDGAKLELAGDMVPLPDMVRQLSEAARRELKVVFYSEEEVEEQKKTNRYVWGQLLIRDMAQFFDVEALRKWGIPLTTFKDFLIREAKAVNETWNPTV